MHRYIWLVPLLPLVGAAVNGLLGRRFRFSERVVGAVGVGSVALAFLISVGAIISYGAGEHAVWPKPYVTSEDGAFAYTWIPGGAVEITQGRAERDRAETAGRVAEEAARVRRERGLAPGSPVLVAGPPAGESPSQGSLLDVEWSYQLDPLSAVFMLIVTGVGLCIFVFATGYMHGDKGFYRFFAYLGLFMFSMLVLVMGSNFMMMFVGWEGVGLCSYLLIGYYFDRREAGDASRKAFITNRIGDFGFALAVFAVIATFGTTQYTSVFEQARAYPIELIGTWGIMSWIALGLFVGACGKSAQIPLHVWLPDAMAGPTPVSALIHAATMVTAGLYMVTRCNVIFQHSQTMMTVVAVVGALTALFAATIGITQNDIKKVLAYSTVSQLGFMFLACGVGAFVIGIFHVMTHAFFKALMFLGAGSVIHAMHHEQDMRRMGGLKRYMPKTYWTFVAGWLAICGVIPFSGFWSKDEILWNAASTEYVPGGWMLWLLATVAATCTAFYMTRLMGLTFWGRERFLEVPAGGQADEAHAQAYADGETGRHRASDPSVADRPHHGPEERVGAAHVFEAAEKGEHEHADAHGHDIHDVHDAHHKGTHGHAHGSVIPHESPASMWVPLAVLAALATVGGFVGISPAFTGGAHVGGKLNIVNWLDPVIWNPATGGWGKGHAEEEHAEGGRQKAEGSQLLASAAAAAAGEAARAQEGGEHGAPLPTRSEAGKGGEASPYGDTGFNLAHSVEHMLGDSHTAAEWFFIVVSLVVAGLGILLGLLFYVWRPHLPAAWAGRLRPLYNASFNKYWVDELYGALFTRRTMDAARGAYQVDSRVIDGAVNGAAGVTKRLSSLTGDTDRLVVDGAVNGLAGFVKLLMSPLLRAAQTGLAANYALVMVLGLVAAVVVFFGADILSAFAGGR
ncbi:MAG TPA: NADH-quinone oxidoreductase subunit L [Pyrinomonadaceae bacterium]|nr:NADH-quinone oxidoreductase subunit L [Pyrinomonadaceae bacterium]